MIKRTLYFGNPAYLSKTNKQLVVRLPAVEKNDTLPESFKKEAAATIPIEDIGVVILDNQQIIITHALVAALLENNVALITCNDTHHPTGLMLPLDVHNIQHERFTIQINATIPQKKQFWQQTVIAKIINQALLLEYFGKEYLRLKKLSESVKSGDTENCEAKAALYYWAHIFPNSLHFSRNREGDPPNNLLNYGYAILRAMMARCLIGSGLLPTFGIHHSNKYNAYCLADDIMEPYRPYMDRIVLQIVQSGVNIEEMTTDIKKELLSVTSIDIIIDSEQSPLMVGMQRTTASLAKCFEGTSRKIVYPILE
ncbi:MAG: type II CRISPR-associated endonuclease Cas1 [Bacteroidetes bacterium]|nr:type II CRISPR-associated endonuclease Cas1 [Bacteroidota bacterium]